MMAEGERLDMKRLRALFPHFSDEEWHDVLWEATAFPCAGAAYVEDQVQEYHDAGFRSVGAILAYSYWQLDFDCALYQPRLALGKGA